MGNPLERKPFFVGGAESLSRDLKADGTVALTAAWDAGEYGITALNLTADPTLGADLDTTFASWTPTGNWTYGSSKWSHATGSDTALDTAIAAVAGTTYQIVVTNTTSTAGGGFQVSYGGITLNPVLATGTNTYYVKPTATTSLKLTPASGTWVGSITALTIKAVTNGAVTGGGTTFGGSQLSVSNGNATYPAIVFPGANDTTAFGAGTDGKTGLWYSPSGYQLAVVVAGSQAIGFEQGQFRATSGFINQLYVESLDCIISRTAAGSFQFGVDAAAPAAQILKAADGSGDDKPGASFSFNGGKSTGTGAGGSAIVQTSTVSTTGSTANTYYDRYQAVGKVLSLTDNSATAVCSFAVVAGATVGGMIVYTIEAVDDDASDKQVESGTVIFCGLQDEANWHTNISEVSTQALESSTLATTWAIDTATADTLKITCLADSGLTTPTLTLRYQVFLNSPIVMTVL